MQVIDAITQTCVRKAGKLFTHLFRQEFNHCVRTARTSAKSSIADSDDECSQPTGAFVLEACMGGHQVRCLNHTARMVLELDAKTEDFIMAWMVPLVRELAHEVGPPATVPACPGPQCSTPEAGFRFSANMTPNIRDKLCWNPLAHAWTVSLVKPKGTPTESFAVDAALPTEDFEEAKSAAYRRAIETWNRLDGSNRQRIPAVPLIGGASGAIASG